MNEAGEDTIARWRGLMDQTVAEVFATMLGCECVPAESCDSNLQNTTARVRYSGALVGECVLLFAAMDAAKLAEKFLGEAADEALVADAVGELCNVVAGGWKRRLRPPASGAGLSVPQVISEASRPSAAGRQSYKFEEAQFAVDLAIQSAIEE